jgi:hypothetical protein
MRRKIFRWLGWVLLLAVMAVLLPPALFLGRVAWRESRDGLPEVRAGYTDAGRLAEGRPVEVIAVDGDLEKAERQIAELVCLANREGRKVTIVGGRIRWPGTRSLTEAWRWICEGLSAGGEIF